MNRWLGRLNTVNGLWLAMPLVVLAALSTYGYQTALLLTLLPVGLCCQQAWRRSSLLALIYYLLFNMEEIADYQHFFHSTPLPAIAVWLIHSAGLACIVSVLYKARKTLVKTILGFWFATILLVLPPLGIFVWVQPIIATGALFPGLGWLGIGLWMVLVSLSIGLVFGIKHRDKNMMSICFVLIAGVLLVALLTNYRYFSAIKTAEPGYLEKFVAINTHFGGVAKSVFDQMKRQQQMKGLAIKAFAAGKHLLIFPENVSDEMVGTQQFWQDILQATKTDDATVIIGSLKQENGKLTKGIHVYTQRDSAFYLAMMPMPLGEWRPFGRYNTQMWQPEIFTLRAGAKKLKITYLICYEQMVPWPLLYTLATQPKVDVVIGIANQWFAGAASYHKQRLSMHLLARLFDLPILLATGW